jgi:hypothetical protein
MKFPRAFKYVIIEDPTGMETAVMFSEHINHSDIQTPNKPVSAGMCKIWSDKEEGGTPVVSCYGETVTLKLRSRNEDAEVIKRMLESFF